MAADDFVKGFLAGGLIGAVVAILYAPKSGEEMRSEIRHSAEELLEKARCQYEEAFRKIETLADREKESIIGKTDRLKKALDAGVEAYKQEGTGTLHS